MRRGLWAGIATAIAVGAVALVSTGCGGAGSALSLDPVAAAATKTQQAGGVRIRLAMHVTGAATGAVDVRGTGAVDGDSSQLDLDLGSRGSLHEISLERNGDYLVYLRLGALASQLPGNKHWVELDVSKLGNSAGLDLGKLLSGGQLQPSDLLSMLNAEGAKVRSLGAATVDGVATTRYHVTIDTAKALESKGLSSPLLAAAAAQLPTVPADVWIGKDGLVRRIRVAAAAAQGRLNLTMDLFDYGTDVKVSAPPSGDVFDATQLAQQGIPGISQ